MANPLAAAQAPSDDWLSDIVRPFMEEFEVPGVAIAIVRTGEPDVARGFGVRALGRPEPVDAHTRFAIGSNAKAFTAAALAILVDEGLLGWDDPVRAHLPQFRMKDRAVGAMVTVRDLLSHRTGLRAFAGDLLYFPPRTCSAGNILRAAASIEPAAGFRTRFDYSNLMYVIAGLLIERVGGASWDRFVAERILAPLGMTGAVPWRDERPGGNVSSGHSAYGPPGTGMVPLRVIEDDAPQIIQAAGGISAGAADMARWLRVQLQCGALPGGARLWSAAQTEQMWKPHVLVASSDGPTAKDPVRAVTHCYGLGWNCLDYRGQRLIFHSGGISGQVSQTALLPAAGIGVAVLTNINEMVMAGIRNAILDRLLDAPAFDWVACFRERIGLMHEAASGPADGGAVKPDGGPSLPLAAYAGRYRDPWYGDIRVFRREEGLAIDFLPTPLFESALEPWGPNAFRTRFPEAVQANAVVEFAVDRGAVIGVTMRPLSGAGTNYDFEDLAFRPVLRAEGACL